jgi:hypothetical protein
MQFRSVVHPQVEFQKSRRVDPQVQNSHGPWERPLELNGQPRGEDRRRTFSSLESNLNHRLRKGAILACRIARNLARATSHFASIRAQSLLGSVILRVHHSGGDDFHLGILTWRSGPHQSSTRISVEGIRVSEGSTPRDFMSALYAAGGSLSVGSSD